MIENKIHTTVPLSDFQDRIRSAVLATLDSEVRKVMDHEGARGWTDAELKVLFAGLDAHIKAVAERINTGAEPGSAFVKIANV